MTRTSGARAKESLVLPAQDEEGFGEARERQHRADTDDDPESGADRLQVR